MSGTLPCITDIYALRGKRVIIRTSLDVPIENGVVTNDFRIKKALPTITHLTEAGARVILLTHVGRDPQSTTEPVFVALKKYISLTHIETVLGDEVQKKISELSDGEVLLLGNLRAHPEEEENDATFAEVLAGYGDYYVNDAFAVSHRNHASIVGIPKYLPSYVGITFQDEYMHLSRALVPEHPSLFIIGGAKFETKEPLIDEYAAQYSYTFIGGALANDFLKARGCEVGESLLSPVDLSQSPLIKNERILTPIDVVAEHEGTRREVSCSEVLPNERVLDIGQKTVEMLVPYIVDAKTILWNGPLGNYEDGYGEGTRMCAELIAQSDAFSIVGGGDTVAAIEALGLGDKFGFLSTAGGAMLEFLEHKMLPGIEALKK